MTRSKLFKAAVLISLPVLLAAYEDSCSAPVPVRERWVLHGKLYEITYGTGVNRDQAEEIFALDSQGQISDTVLKSDPLFNDISVSAAQTRAANAAASSLDVLPGRQATAAPQYVVHFLNTTGSRIRRFDTARNVIDQNVQLTCTDTIESASSLTVSDDNSVGIVLTRGSNNHRWCAIVFDPVTYAIRAKLPIATEPERGDATAISPDNATAYVLTDFSTNTQQYSNVYSIDLTAPTLALGQPIVVNQSRLQWMAMSTDGARLFLSSSFPSAVFALDLNTGETTRFTTVPNYVNPYWMAMHPFGHKLYLIVNAGSQATVLNVIDTSTGALLSSTRPFTDDTDFPGFAIRGMPQFTPDGRYLFVMGGYKKITMIDTIDDSVVQRFPLSYSLASNDLAAGFFFLPAP